VTKSDGTAVRADATEVSLEDIEIQLLLEGIRLTYGYDFREYAMTPLRRNVVAAMQAEGVPTISSYQDRILHDATCMQRFLGMVGVTVTSMFRELELTHALRDEVIPVLRTYPSVRVWMVGCATGEEAPTHWIGCGRTRKPTGAPAAASRCRTTTRSPGEARDSAGACRAM
jgi:hypothetical protein